MSKVPMFSRLLSEKYTRKRGTGDGSLVYHFISIKSDSGKMPKIDDCVQPEEVAGFSRPTEPHCASTSRPAPALVCPHAMVELRLWNSKDIFFFFT